jgi:pimeloyl-ACP methyl ester carboxylesterase
VSREGGGAAADEFASLVEVAHELGYDRSAIPAVGRRSVEVGAGQTVSTVVWGSGDPELAFVHGGGQNARTWDLVAMGLGRAAVAIDLPGHGHSSWRADRDYGPINNARAVAVVVEQLAPRAAGVIGMSLGGMTAIRLAATSPELVRRLVLVDVTPGSGRAARRMTREQRGATALIRGQRSFTSLEQMVGLAVQASPRRPAAAVRRGVVHNTMQQPDGTWVWRYDLHDADADGSAAERDTLWNDVDRLSMPTMLVRGGDSVFVTSDDLAELTRRNPGIRVETVAGAGHAVQSDRPQALTALIRDFLPG